LRRPYGLGDDFDFISDVSGPWFERSGDVPVPTGVNYQLLQSDVCLLGNIAKTFCEMFLFIPVLLHIWLGHPDYTIHGLSYPSLVIVNVFVISTHSTDPTKRRLTNHSLTQKMVILISPNSREHRTKHCSCISR